jgi:hypothetical protein
MIASLPMRTCFNAVMKSSASPGSLLAINSFQHASDCSAASMRRLNAAVRSGIQMGFFPKNCKKSEVSEVFGAQWRLRTGANEPAFSGFGDYSKSCPHLEALIASMVFDLRSRLWPTWLACRLLLWVHIRANLFSIRIRRFDVALLAMLHGLNAHRASWHSSLACSRRIRLRHVRHSPQHVHLHVAAARAAQAAL